MNRMFYRKNSRRGGQVSSYPDGLFEAGHRYQAPAVEYIYCDETAPLLDSPNAGFTGDEGGLEIEDLD